MNKEIRGANIIAFTPFFICVLYAGLGYAISNLRGGGGVLTEKIWNEIEGRCHDILSLEAATITNFAESTDGNRIEFFCFVWLVS